MKISANEIKVGNILEFEKDFKDRKLKENEIITRDQLADLSSYELIDILKKEGIKNISCLLYTSPSPRDS